MAIEKVYDLVSRGKAKLVPAAVAEAIEAGCAPADVLSTMISAMDVVGEKFKNGEIFVPEMLIAAKAMKKGVEVLKPIWHPALPALWARWSSAPFRVTCTTSARTWLP